MKNPSQIQESDHPHNLPNGWIYASIDDVCLELIGGGTPSREKPEYFGGDIIWLTPTEIPKEKISVISNSKEKITKKGFDASSTRFIPRGAVLLTSRATIGAVAIAGCEVTTNQGFASLTCSRAIYNLYLAYFLWGNKDLLDYYSKGTTFKEISKSTLRELSLPLPPLQEQKRIVSKIEELFTKLDSGIEALKKTQLLLKKYRQSVLKYAFEGKLTEKWRQANKDKIEPISKILDIKEDREFLNLRYGWATIELGKISDMVEKVDPKKNPKKEFIYIDISSIDKNYKIVDPKRYFGINAPSRARQRIKQGDILFSTVRTYLKHIAIVDKIYANQIASTGFCVIRPIKQVSSKYIFYMTLYDEFLNPLNNLQRGTSYPAVRNSDVFSQIIPIASTYEQLRIAEEIDYRFSVIQNSEKVIGDVLKYSESLRRSILKSAFEGNLVSQDPNDEHAEVLLEKIEGEKPIIENKNNSKRSKNKSDSRQMRLN